MHSTERAERYWKRQVQKLLWEQAEVKTAQACLAKRGLGESWARGELSELVGKTATEFTY